MDTYKKFISGPTPIARVMRQILQEKRSQIQDRKLLLLIATDGIPTDDDGHPKIEEFRDVLKYERNPIDRIPVTIIACTGQLQLFDSDRVNNLLS